MEISIYIYVCAWYCIFQVFFFCDNFQNIFDLQLDGDLHDEAMGSRRWKTIAAHCFHNYSAYSKGDVEMLC